jgi:copper(I)-binding protein
VAVIRSTSRSVLAGLVVVGGLALAGCGSGQVAQTAQQQGTIDGVSVQVGQLAVRDIALEYPNAGVYKKGTTARLRMVVVNQGISADVLTDVRSPAASGVTITDDSATAQPGGGSPSATPFDTSSPSASASAGASPSGSATPSGSDSASGSATPSGAATPSATPSPSAAPTPTTAANAQIAIPPNGYVSFENGSASVQLTGLVNQLYPAQTLQVTLVFQKAGSVTTTIAVGVSEGQVSLAPEVSTGADS